MQSWIRNQSPQKLLYALQYQCGITLWNIIDHRLSKINGGRIIEGTSSLGNNIDTMKQALIIHQVKYTKTINWGNCALIFLLHVTFYCFHSGMRNTLRISSLWYKPRSSQWRQSNVAISNQLENTPWCVFFVINGSNGSYLTVCFLEASIWYLASKKHTVARDER